jgi:hypothetical protein
MCVRYLQAGGDSLLYVGVCLKSLSSQALLKALLKTIHCVGDVEQRMKPLPTFFVSVKLWLHTDMRN